MNGAGAASLSGDSPRRGGKRNRLRFAGLLALALFAQSARGTPEVQNPSFEATGPLIWPGLGLISNWTAVGLAGINPYYPEATGGNDLSYQYANNGLIPHGTNVAFLASNSERDVDTSLTQTVPGFEEGKTYVVRFFHNGAVRTGSFAGIFMNLKLGAATLINFEYMNLGEGAIVPWGVEDYLHFTKPYRRRLTSEWTAPASGSYDLVFSMESNYRTDFPAGTPYENRKLLGNSAWLIDNVSIVELGSLELIGARRNYTNTTQIVATFNQAIREDRGTNAKNYRLDGVLAITQAEMISTNQVLLTTSVEATENSLLRVEDLVDLGGKGMFRTRSEKTVDASPRLPGDFSVPTTGFEDDFNSAIRDPRWVFAGEGTDVFTPFYGVLQVRPVAGENNFLLWNAPELDPVDQEILMRLRFTQTTSGTPAGGAAAAVSTRTLDGVKATATPAGLFLAGRNLSGGPTQTNAIQTGPWYWLRLKHRSSADPAVQDALAKIWLADGETAEPPDVGWNYAPASELRRGLAGIAAGANSSSAFEVDYILIKTPTGPPLEPHYPSAFPEALILERVSNQLQVRWRTMGGFQLYFRDDLGASAWQVVEGEISDDPASGFSTYLVPDAAGQRFYQLIGN